MITDSRPSFRSVPDPHRPIRIALLGDFNERVAAHRAIPEALKLAAAAEHVQVEIRWIETAELTSPIENQLAEFDAVWCVPASPYRNPSGVMQAIRFAREHDRPFLGTCGGFQHALLEFCRNVLGMADAAHAEEQPGAEKRVIAPLTCGLIGANAAVLFRKDSRLRAIYEKSQSVEGYHCNYGLNAEYRARIEAGGLRVAAEDKRGEVRAVELDRHPFFVATLFQPELLAFEEVAPPLVRALLRSAQRQRGVPRTKDPVPRPIRYR
jgi:CTP synthase (UTP-ammonia lyase)